MKSVKSEPEAGFIALFPDFGKMDRNYPRDFDSIMFNCSPVLLIGCIPFGLFII